MSSIYKTAGGLSTTNVIKQGLFGVNEWLTREQDTPGSKDLTKPVKGRIMMWLCKHMV